tara:strand:+ start:223 stop:615 length:393 start_codon:yes stop_codon:yes gene_type:complete
MKINRKQLRQIIRKTIILNESIPGVGGGDQTFGAEAPHPLLKNNYAGNGWIVSVFDGAPREFAKANASKSQHFQLLSDILDGRVKLPYVPFIFADELMDEFSKHGLDPQSIQALDNAMVGEDNEYDAPGW